MSKKKNGRDRLYEFCDELYPEDGLSSQDIFKFFQHQSKKANYHQMKLCREVRDELELILHGEARDDFWWLFQVIDVLQIENSPALEVQLEVSLLEDEMTLSDCEAELLKRKAWLKFEVARAIHRKRMPDLKFSLFCKEGGFDE